MSCVDRERFHAGPDDIILVTGAGGFIGMRVAKSLLDLGFRRIRCLVRPSSDEKKVSALRQLSDSADLELLRGNLLSREDCAAAVQDAAVVIHLAAGRGQKSFPDAFMNSVVTTRNLLEACARNPRLKRFVNVSSFAVYTNKDGPRGNLLDETCPVEQKPHLRGDAYTFAKTKQEEIVAEYARKCGIPCVNLRPGVVYGPGNLPLTGRVGIGTFGLFLHLGGSNTIPLTFVDNCAEAIALAGLIPGVDGEAFNVVDDNLPSSRKLLRLYKRNVRKFASLPVPKTVSYLLCYLWERYSIWSEGQLPPAFTRGRWNSFWKKTRYTNSELKTRLGWNPRISTEEGLRLYFEACRMADRHA